MTLRLSRRRLKLLIWLLAVSGVIAGPYVLGRQVSPPTAGAPPPIYSLALRRTETYRRAAQGWLAALGGLDQAAVVALQTDASDVYALSQQAQGLLARATRLEQQVALTYPPVSLVSLRDQVQLAADAYLQAALAISRWVGEPMASPYTAALEAMRVARSARIQAAQNPWLQASAAVPVNPDPALLPVTAVSGTPVPELSGWDE